MTEVAALNLFTLDPVTATTLCVALARAAAPGPWAANPQALQIDASPAVVAPRRRAFGLLSAAAGARASTTRPCAVVVRDHTGWLERAMAARARIVYLRPSLFQSLEMVRELVATHDPARTRLNALIALDARLARCEQIPLEHLYGAGDPAARDSLARIGLDAAQVSRAAVDAGRDCATLYAEAMCAMMQDIALESPKPVSAVAALVARVAPGTILALTQNDAAVAAAVETAARSVGFEGAIEKPPPGETAATVARLDPAGAQTILTLVLHPSRLGEAPPPTPARPLGVSLEADEDAPYPLLVAAAQGGVAVEFAERFVSFFAASHSPAALSV